MRRTISQQADAPRPISDGPLRVRMLRWPVASPDGSRLAFQALNKVWVAGPDGSLRRLTPESFRDPEWTPSWSPDGCWIAFTTWDDPGRGHVWKVSAEGGESVSLTRAAGEYLHPVWSPDGRELLIVRGPGVYAPGFTWVVNPRFEVSLLSSDGGEPKTVTRVSKPRFVFEPCASWREISRPSFGPGGRIFFPEHRKQEGNFVTDLLSVSLDGTDRKVHATFPLAEDVGPSPDGRWIAREEGSEVFLHPFPQPGADGKPPLPERQAGRQLTRTGRPALDRQRHLGIGNGDCYYLCKGPRGLPVEGERCGWSVRALSHPAASP